MFARLIEIYDSEETDSEYLGTILATPEYMPITPAGKN